MSWNALGVVTGIVRIIASRDLAILFTKDWYGGIEETCSSLLRLIATASSLRLELYDVDVVF